jgi:hypothetical protein
MIFSLLTQQLQSLSALLLLLSNKQYDQKAAHLGNASIGGHTRHIIELLKCVLNGYEAGTVDYMNRQRNLLLETNRQMALQELDLLTSKITRADKPMYLITECNAVVCTTFYREVVYNAEHTVHHLALIKVALREMNLDITHDDFGMAPSTIKYLAAQNKN